MINLYCKWLTDGF